MTSHEALNFPWEQGQQGTEVAVQPWFPWESCHGFQCAHPHEVVHGGRKGEHPPDPRHAAIAGLAQQSNGFHPTKDLFHTFPFAPTHRIAWMARRPTIDGTRSPAGMLGDMRGYVQLTQLSDEVTGIIVLVSAQGDPLLPRNRFGHR